MEQRNYPSVIIFLTLLFRTVLSCVEFTNHTVFSTSVEIVLRVGLLSLCLLLNLDFQYV
jgi:hypothetical protein